MESRTASTCPPMILREREILDATQLQFLIPPLPNIFLATATQVLTKGLLTIFINNLLSTLHHDSLLTDIPSSGCWGLEGHENGYMNLDSWDPRQANVNVYKVIALPVMSDPATLTSIYPQSSILGGGSWLQTSSVKSIQLPSKEIFEIQGSHLLIVVHRQVKVRVSNRKSRTEETKHSVLIPSDLKVGDLVKAFQVIGKAARLFEIPDLSSKLCTTDIRTAMELGWRHGTELRLDIL